MHQKNELYETDVAKDTTDRRARAHDYRHIEAQLEDPTEKLARLRAMGAGAASR